MNIHASRGPTRLLVSQRLCAPLGNARAKSMLCIFPALVLAVTASPTLPGNASRRTDVPLLRGPNKSPERDAAARAQAHCQARTWEPCNRQSCCRHGDTCYEKNVHYAQCQPSGHCKPGLHKEDPIQEPWTCKVLSPWIDCVDLNNNCAAWAAKGDCTTNPEYMLQVCQQTCQNC